MGVFEDDALVLDGNFKLEDKSPTPPSSGGGLNNMGVLFDSIKKEEEEDGNEESTEVTANALLNLGSTPTITTYGGIPLKECP
jgi:hypothetical protein